MTTIKKTIQNLKPGEQYLLTVKPKNSDVNATLNPSSAIRFVVPSDATVPQDLGNLIIVGNYKSIMISFNPSNEADLLGYNYEVYLPESIEQSGSIYSVISGQTSFLSGFSSSNVISLDVPENTQSINSIDSISGVTTTTTTEKIYFARVQSIDTSNNKSSFTPITASTATTLIDSAHIINLTASKITAGTIGAHTITMAGGTSVIKSSTFDGVDVGGGSYSNATTGWLINGSGRAYFYDATIAGSIDIGGFDSGSFHVDDDGNLWLGSGTLVNAPFKVLKEGDVTANTITTQSLTLTGNTVISSNAKIFLGVGVYSNANTPFYVDDTSQFSLGDKLTFDGATLTVKGVIKLSDNSSAINAQEASDIAEGAIDELQEEIYTDGFIGGLTISPTQLYYGAGSFGAANTAFYVAKNINTGQADFSLGNKLTWDGSTLNITGNVVITGGSTLASINEAQSDADEAKSTANTAFSTAISAQGIAITAETKADNAQDDADSAFSLASTKITAGEVVTTINGGSTTISGNKITTGTLTADSVVAGFINAFNINADNITAGTISGINISGSTFSTGNFSVDSAGSMNGRNVTIDAGFRYRCAGVFGSTGSTTLARINNPGGAEQLCSAASKREYKYNIEDIPSALSILKTVRPRIFNWNLDAFDQLDPWTNEPWTDQARALNEFNKSYGFIAEEMAEDQPFLTVYEAPDQTLPMDQPGGVFDLSAWEPKMWKEMDFIPLLVKAVQELSAKVETLESYLFNAPSDQV